MRKFKNRARNLLFFMVMIAILYAIFEFVSFKIYRATEGKPFEIADIIARQQALQKPDVAQEDVTANQSSIWAVPHPYLGFAWNKNDKQPLYQEYGFLGEVNGLEASQEKDTVIIGITGGSVAQYFFDTSRDILRDYLKTVPAFENKKIVFIMLGMPAYKQPQQLMAVTYYLSLGGRLDALINIDGHNEVVIGNGRYSRHVYPAFPEFWSEFLEMVRPEYALSAGRAIYLKKWRVKVAHFFSNSHFSVTWSTCWDLLDRYIENEVKLAGSELKTNATKETPQFLLGPQISYNDSENIGKKIILDIWEHGNAQLRNLAKTNGFAYFHFIQPSQYVPDSKPFSEEEKSTALKDIFAAEKIHELYPLLEAKMRELRSRGENIYSLTSVFKSEKETVYIDDCCHMNKYGHDIIAEEIGNIMIRDWPSAINTATQ